RPTTSRPSIPCAAAFVCCYSAPCPPPPFPTRRSSDLAGRHRDDPVAPHGTAPHHGRPGVHRRRASRDPARRIADVTGHPDAGIRSEEHTSELQSRFDLVCRLLLEKKKSATRRAPHPAT